MIFVFEKIYNEIINKYKIENIYYKCVYKLISKAKIKIPLY